MKWKLDQNEEEWSDFFGKKVHPKKSSGNKFLPNSQCHTLQIVITIVTWSKGITKLVTVFLSIATNMYAEKIQYASC